MVKQHGSWYLAKRILLTGGLQPDREAYEDVLKKVSTSMPDKYVPRSLSPKDRATQRRNILKSRAAYKQGKYLSRPKVKSFKSKPSRHVVKAKKMYGIESMTDLDALHRATGYNRSSMEKILNKGRGAFYSSGVSPQPERGELGAGAVGERRDGRQGREGGHQRVAQEGGCNDSVVQMALGAGGFNWMSYADAHAFEARAAREGVSEVARGLAGSCGCTRRTHRRRPWKKCSTATFRGRSCDNFVKRHLAQYRKNPTRRRYLAMVMWAYDAGWPFRGGRNKVESAKWAPRIQILQL